MVTMRTVDDAIREDEAAVWCDDMDQYAGECSSCGKMLGNSREVIALLDVKGHKVVLCGECAEKMPLTEFLDTIGLKYFEGRADEAEKAVTVWEADTARRKRMMLGVAI